jgi:FMN phosphatase YigB (HAD superfamily)
LPGVPLLLVDLDNTLIDRSAAFARWARGLTAAQGRSAADVRWLVAADRDGLESRERLAAMIIGDSAEADIGGARKAGLTGVWLHRGRPWPLTEFRPGHTAESFARAVQITLTATG